MCSLQTWTEKWHAIMLTMFQNNSKQKYILSEPSGRVFQQKKQE